MGGLGLLGLSAAVAAIAFTVIFSCSIIPLIIITAELSAMAFLISFGFGVGLTIASAVEFADKCQTQNKLVKLYDKLDQATEHLKNNADKIRNWIEVQQADIQSKLKTFDEGNVLNLDLNKIRKRNKLCTDLTKVLPKIAIASK